MAPAEERVPVRERSEDGAGVAAGAPAGTLQEMRGVTYFGDRRGALGAKRTYAHRTNPGGPYLPEAQAALRDWELSAAKTSKKGPAVQANCGGCGPAPH